MCSTTPRNRFLAARLCGIPLFAASISATAAGQCHYTLTEIPNPPGWYATAMSINNRGHVAGWLSNLGETYRAFFWSPETGTVILPLPPGCNDMQAMCLNDLDQVAGTAFLQGRYWGYVWDGKYYTFLPPPSWAHRVDVRDINDAGQVVGTISNVQVGPVHAFVWQDGVITDIGLMPEFSLSSFGYAIAESGIVVGTGYGFPLDYWHAFEMGDSIRWLPEPSGIILSQANGANNNGFFAGYGAFVPVGSNFRRRAIIWSPWGAEIVPPPGSQNYSNFYSVNDAGRAVGAYEQFLYTAIAWQNGSVVVLRDIVEPRPVRSFENAYDINNAGQIVVNHGMGSAVLNPVWIRGDLTGDCHVTIDDLLIVLSNFGLSNNSFPRGDSDGDGEVGLSDLALVLSHWGS